MVFLRYDSVGDILKPSGDPGVTDYSRYAGTGEITVNSRVVAAAIKPADVYQLDHVTFTLRHNEVEVHRGLRPLFPSGRDTESLFVYILNNVTLWERPEICLFTLVDPERFVKTSPRSYFGSLSLGLLKVAF